MNWYGKILFAQVWDVEGDNSFEEDLKAFYELEYKYQSLKNFPFSGHPKRYQNIFTKVENSLQDAMESLRDTLISTFGGWLDSHALTNPAQWAERRTDPHGSGFMGSYDAEEALDGIIGEYIRYKYTGGRFDPYNQPNTSSVLSEIMDQALAMSEQFSSLKGVVNTLQVGERLENELYSDEFENFGENERGEAFQSEEEAEAYIEEMVENVNVSDFMFNFGKEELLSILDGMGQMENFLVKLNQYIVFPVWYEYWKAMGIDTTRELAQEAYEELVNAKSFEQFHRALEIAIQTCHQGGSMLDYLSDFGGRETESSPEDIEGLMNELTDGKMNSGWDEQLKEIGVQLPISVIKRNLEQAVA